MGALVSRIYRSGRLWVALEAGEIMVYVGVGRSREQAIENLSPAGVLRQRLDADTAEQVVEADAAPREDDGADGSAAEDSRGAHGRHRLEKFLRLKADVFATSARDPKYAALVAALNRAGAACEERGIRIECLSLTMLDNGRRLS